MREPLTNTTDREPYEKPRLRVVALAAEEVLGTGCKTATTAGTNPGSPSNCTGTVCATVDNS